MEPESIPARISWYLTDLAEFKGRQELHTLQSPQILQRLREYALVQSAVSSNRIEGVEVDLSRIGTLVFGKPALRDRDEEEVRGYRDALNLIHRKSDSLTLNENLILEFHRRSRGQIWDAGQYKEKSVDIIQTYADGRSRVRFHTLAPEQTPAGVREMIELWHQGLREKWTHPLLLIGALNLDFLCIHPFRDGNGRVSRILLLLSLYQCGYDVGRYISIERLIEENKDRYYETLEQSSQGWHEGKNDPWPYLGYLLFIFRLAYHEFEDRVGTVQAPRGQKSALVRSAIARQEGAFRIADLQRECPGVSVDTIRKVMKKLKGVEIECLGRGQSAQWQKINS